MLLYDLCIAVGSAGLAIVTIPTLTNKQTQIPRWLSSVPIASFLTFMVPFFYLEGLILTMFMLVAQAIVWWLIAVYRPVKPLILENQIQDLNRKI